MSAMHVLVSVARNFPFSVLLTVEILDFFAYVLVFSHFTPLPIFCMLLLYKKKLLIMPSYPCFASCDVLRANSSFTYNEATLINQVS